jgi:NAD-dependent dihydropyrimidine dehydrogenase PreA subunit
LQYIFFLYHDANRKSPPIDPAKCTGCLQCEMAC